MANLDTPKGFWPVGHLTGGFIRTREYTMTASTTIYDGDLLQVSATGTVEPAAVDAGTDVIGVASAYKVSAATGVTKLAVYDDPNTIFGVQADGAVAETSKFDTANHVAGSGNATTKLSGHELDASDIGTGTQLRVIGKEDVIGNAWSANVNLLVILNEHKLYGSSIDVSDIADNTTHRNGDGSDHADVATLNTRVDQDVTSGAAPTLLGTNITALPLDNTTITKIAGATYGSGQDALQTFGHAGIISGGVLTDAGSANLDISAGQGFIRSTDAGFGELFSCDWAASNGNAIPTDTIRYVGVEYNAGSPQVIISSTNNFNHHTTFRLGTVVNESDTLHILTNPQKARDAGADMMERIYETEPFKRADRLGGLILGETGTRNITVTAGELYDALNEFNITAKDTSGADTFDSYSAGGQESTGNTQWDNLQYDNAGTLATLGAAKYANHWFYIEADDALVHVYGTAQYSTAAAAQAEGAPATIPDRLTAHGKLLGRIIFQKSAASATLIESVFTTTFSGAGAASHNDTSGLQGGTTDEYFHATSAEYTALTGAEQGVLTVTIGDGTNAITTGAQAVYVDAPHAGTFTTAEVVAKESGSIVLDVWKDTYANFPPTVADTITAAAKPTLSGAQKSTDSTLTGWTKTFSKGDRFEVNVDSATTVTRVILTLKYDITGA
jgi:hypothetical protein